MATYDAKQIALPGGDIANLKDGNAIHKSNTSGLVKNDGSIDQNTYQIAQEGKGLSTNDFTNDDKAMIGNIYANNTILSTDRTPYLNRPCLTPTGFSSYVREKLIGCSVAWNNLCNGSSVTVPSGHKYLLKKNGVLSLGESTGSAITGLTSGTDIVTDLTLAFGSTVADTLYAMTNNGGIDWLRNHNYPIDQYTQYGYGLYSTKPSAKKVVGKNLIDESTYQLGDAAHGSMSTAFSQSDNRPYLKAGTPFVLSINGVGSATAWISVSAKPNSSDISEFISIDFISSQGFSNGNPIIGTMPVSGYLAFSIQNIYGNLENAKALKLQLEVGSSNTAYEPYIGITYSLGSTELRGHLIVQNGEIVAEGDVRESNGDVTRKWAEVDLGDFTWQNSYGCMISTTAPNNVKVPSDSTIITNWLVCAKYKPSSPAYVYNKTDGDRVISIRQETGLIYVYDSAYTDATAFKTAVTGLKMAYQKATPTTETSSPFADPMSLNGCTTEEYVDDRSIPVPVGHETQYMGQSEDVVEIPSGSLSDGKRKLVAETSGGKTQYYFEGEEEEDSEDISGVLHVYTGYTLSNVHAKKYGKVIEIAFTSTGSYEYLTGLYVAYLTAYKPPKELSFTVYNSINIPVGGGWITTSGIIYIRSNVDATLTEIKINTMYII